MCNFSGKRARGSIEKYYRICRAPGSWENRYRVWPAMVIKPLWKPAKTFPEAIIQQCVVHVKRQTKNYLSAKPQLPEARQLLHFSRQVTHIKKIELCDVWLTDIHRWYNQNPSIWLMLSLIFLGILMTMKYLGNQSAGGLFFSSQRKVDPI